VSTAENRFFRRKSQLFAKVSKMSFPTSLLTLTTKENIFVKQGGDERLWRVEVPSEFQFHQLGDHF